MSELSVGSLSGLAANSYVIDVASGSRLTQPGMIVDVKDIFKTDTFTASVGAGANTTITGMSISHALANSSNKLIITAFVGAAASSDQRAPVCMAVADGGTLIGTGEAVGSRVQAMAGGFASGTTSSLVVRNLTGSFVYSPGDTASHTYTLEIINNDLDTNTVYVNRTQSDANDVANARTSSGLIIQEVAG